MSINPLLERIRAKDPSRQGSLDEFERWVRNEGVRAGLMYLNSLVPPRFTVLYRLHQNTLYCTSAFDANQEISGVDLQEVPLADSYCQFVLRDGRYVTCDALHEPLLDGHKYQQLVRSYLGMPVLDKALGVYGTLCHFDFDTRPVDDSQTAFLRAAAERFTYLL